MSIIFNCDKCGKDIFDISRRVTVRVSERNDADVKLYHFHDDCFKALTCRLDIKNTHIKNTCEEIDKESKPKKKGRKPGTEVVSKEPISKKLKSQDEDLIEIQKHPLTNSRYFTEENAYIIHQAFYIGIRICYLVREFDIPDQSLRNYRNKWREIEFKLDRTNQQEVETLYKTNRDEVRSFMVKLFAGDFEEARNISMQFKDKNIVWNNIIILKELYDADIDIKDNVVTENIKQKRKYTRKVKSTKENVEQVKEVSKTAKKVLKPKKVYNYEIPVMDCDFITLNNAGFIHRMLELKVPDKKLANALRVPLSAFKLYADTYRMSSVANTNPSLVDTEVYERNKKNFGTLFALLRTASWSYKEAKIEANLSDEDARTIWEHFPVFVKLYEEGLNQC